jgi:sugar lactone lactonase YvrE
MTVPTLRASPLGLTSCRLGEGPVWSRERHELVFVDIDGRRLHRYDWSTGALHSREFEQPVCAVALTSSGGLLIALDDRLVVEEDGRTTTLNADALPPDVRFNDGGCDPRGRFYIGSTHRADEDGHGALLRLDGHRLTPVRDQLGWPNGLAWTADGSTICHVDSLRRTVWVSDYDVETGAPHGRSRVIDLSEHPGWPDGMTIDEEDCLWIAFYEGARVLRLDLAGNLLLRVDVPVPMVTSCAFAGAGLDALAITTANPEGDPAEGWGDLFHVEVGIRGKADFNYREPPQTAVSRPVTDDTKVRRPCA